MYRHCLFLTLLLCSLSRLLAQAPTLPASALCSPDGGPFALVAAPTPSGGATYLYQQQADGTWHLTQTLSLADGNPLSGPVPPNSASVFASQTATISTGFFGTTTQISGDYAVVSYRISADEFGNNPPFTPLSATLTRSYLYQHSQGTWSLQAILPGGAQAVLAQDQLLLLDQEAVVVDAAGSLATNFYTTLRAYDLSQAPLQGSALFSYFSVDEPFISLYQQPTFQLSLSPDGQVAALALTGDPIDLSQHAPIETWRRQAGTWVAYPLTPAAAQVFGPPFEYNFLDVACNAGDKLVLGGAQEIFTWQGHAWVADPQAQATPDAPQLSVDANTAILVTLSWTDVACEAEYGVFRQIPGQTPQLLTVLCANQTSYTDTLLAFGQSAQYYVEAVNQFGSTLSNVVSYSMPAAIQPLSLSFVCYTPQTDSLTWRVHNPNPQAHPYVFAQWWSTQRGERLAPSGTSTFQTKNNPQSPQTYGDDNITGIWWIDQQLKPGRPFSLVRNRIRLSQACPTMRRSSRPAAPLVGLTQGQLGQYLQVHPHLADLMADQIHAFPNPVQTHLTLQLDSEADQVILRIYDLGGRLLQRRNLPFQPTLSVDLRDLPQGTYLLEVQADAAILRQPLLKL